MILVDANVVMYAVGAPHEHKAPSDQLLERIIRGEVSASIDTETLQEILNRYRAAGDWARGATVYDKTRRVFANAIPITLEVVDAARKLLDSYPHLSARDAIHAAVCKDASAKAICSYDTDFDGIDGLRRLEPPDVA